MPASNCRFTCKTIQTFLRDQSGAVTTDWVVIGAAALGLGLTSAVAVRNGSTELGANIMRSLAETEVAQILTTAAGMNGNGDVNETATTSTLADGRTVTNYYVDGKLVRQEQTDPDNAHGWATLVNHYDSSGKLTLQEQVHDDGRLIDTKYVDGKVSEQSQTDPENRHGWRGLKRIYDENGQIISAVVENDNRSSYSEVFKDGRVDMRVHRNPEGATTMVENHSYKLDEAGQMTERQVLYSDGRELTTTYDNNRATGQIMLDADNKHTWSNQQWTYDAEGRTSGLAIGYDDGSRRDYAYVENRITQSTLRNSAGQIVSNETRSYDQLGRLARQDITHDDGRIQVVEFADGVRRSQTITDPNNAHWWSSQTWQFDETNRTAGYTVVYNDGRQRVDTHINGRTSEHVVLSQTGQVQETARYSYTTDSFDRLTGRTITYSDGRESVTTYDANRPLVQTITDNGNAHSWTSQVHTYDSMNRTERVLITYDDGRVAEDVYAEGTRTERVWRDSDGNVTDTQVF